MKVKRMVSLRYKMLFFSFLMAIVPILIVGSSSYVISTNIIREQASRSNMETIKQIANNIEFIINDVKGISFNLIENEELNQYLKSPEFHRISDVHNILDDYILTKKYIYSIYVQDLQGNGVDTQGAVNHLNDTEIAKLKMLNGKESWFLSDVSVVSTNLKLISLSRMIRDVNHIDRGLGILKINLSQDQIQSIYRHKIMDEKEILYIIDSQGTVLSSISESMIGQPLDSEYIHSHVYENDEGYYFTDIHDEKYLVVFYTIEDAGWKLIHYVPSDRITEHSEVIKQITVISICLSLLICLLFLLFFMVKVLKPLKQIRLLMKNLEQENFNVNMVIQGNDEIALFSRSFIKMSQKLDELFNEVHVVRIKQKEAEIKALEEQINPHFLYNTLDLIYWMGRMEKAFETSEMIRTLSNLFRLGLNNGSGFTTVRREVEYIKHYMVIQQKRYEDSITYSIDASSESMDLKVIKLILQPLVENAITHGIEKKDGKGHISVRIYCKQNILIYEVEDDGAGMESSLIEEVLSQSDTAHKGIGLRNINDRIRLSYGPTFGLQIESKLGQGTKVTVKQAIQKGEDEHEHV